jgi:hypothetical protein
VAKSDTLVTKELHEALRAAFDTLKVDHTVSPDWHPNSDDMVQDLVHPSMYPFVYDRTGAHQEECVGLQDAGTGKTVPKDDWQCDPVRDRFSYGVGGGDVPPQYWSQTYQWLPANVAFQDDGSVKFTSYINNLHPQKYASIYRTIEKMIETSLPMWDQCLAMGSGYSETKGAGRNVPRMCVPENAE